MLLSFTSFSFSFSFSFSLCCCGAVLCRFKSDLIFLPSLCPDWILDAAKTMTMNTSTSQGNIHETKEE